MAKIKKVLISRGLLPLFAEKRIFLDRSAVALFTADTNDDILKTHRREKLDLIITELDLPGISSESLFDIIRGDERLRKISLIVVCRDAIAQRARCRRMNATAVFSPPVDVAQMHKKAEQFLKIAPRMNYRAAVAVAISGKFREQPVPFWTENLSASGMLIRSEEPLRQGDSIFLSFFLSDGTHVSGYGDIVRGVRISTAPNVFLYGVRFTRIDDEAAAAIEAAVERATAD